MRLESETNRGVEERYTDPRIPETDHMSWFSKYDPSLHRGTIIVRYSTPFLLNHDSLSS